MHQCEMLGVCFIRTNWGRSGFPKWLWKRRTGTSAELGLLKDQHSGLARNITKLHPG